MRSTIAAVACWCALAAALFSGGPAYAGTFPAKVVVVIDGDTLVVRDDRAVRYEIRVAGIDAPEIRQPYGVRSRGHLAEMLYGKRVLVSWYKRDRYHRVLAHIALVVTGPCGPTVCTRTVDAGYAQLLAGFAWHDREHVDEQSLDERRRYASAEQDARARRAGLWAESAPMPPWRYRHLHPRRVSERLFPR